MALTPVVLNSSPNFTLVTLNTNPSFLPVTLPTTVNFIIPGSFRDISDSWEDETRAWNQIGLLGKDSD
tara:strand:- start:101 stop:304 length:204 start_codon:yes stop_codon:yes gene_type:complete